MSVKMEIWGETACFTRPEMKAERVSYDVPTPSAIRGERIEMSNIIGQFFDW